MGVNKTTSFKKYYVYKHRNGEEIEYFSHIDLHADYAFLDSLEYAHLFLNEYLAVLRASAAKKMSTDEGMNFCVGCVTIDVDPLYFPKVV